MSVLNITCGVCHKLVDFVERSDDWGTRDVVLRVSCHGEWDEMRLDPSRLSLDQLRAMEQSQGVAFERRLSNPQIQRTPGS